MGQNQSQSPVNTTTNSKTGKTAKKVKIMEDLPFEEKPDEVDPALIDFSILISINRDTTDIKDHPTFSKSSDPAIKDILNTHTKMRQVYGDKSALYISLGLILLDFYSCPDQVDNLRKMIENCAEYFKSKPKHSQPAKFLNSLKCTHAYITGCKKYSCPQLQDGEAKDRKALVMRDITKELEQNKVFTKSLITFLRLYILKQVETKWPSIYSLLSAKLTQNIFHMEDCMIDAFITQFCWAFNIEINAIELSCKTPFVKLYSTLGGSAVARYTFAIFDVKTNSYGILYQNPNSPLRTPEKSPCNPEIIAILSNIPTGMKQRNCKSKSEVITPPGCNKDSKEKRNKEQQRTEQRAQTFTDGTKTTETCTKCSTVKNKEECYTNSKCNHILCSTCIKDTAAKKKRSCPISKCQASLSKYQFYKFNAACAPEKERVKKSAHQVVCDFAIIHGDVHDLSSGSTTPNSHTSFESCQTDLTPNATSSDDFCIMCDYHKKNIVFYKCGHSCCCGDCGQQLGQKACPLCEKPVVDVLNMFVV
jgi:hypothetical protein